MNLKNNKYPGDILLQMRELKSSIRQILRQRKDSMTPEERLEKSKRICCHLLELITDGETVMVYTSKEKEVNTANLITTLLGRGNPVVVPIIVKEDISLRLSYLIDLSSLVTSTFGVPEPIGSEIPVTGDDVNTIILPMHGFDRTGRRKESPPAFWRKFSPPNQSGLCVYAVPDGFRLSGVWVLVQTAFVPCL